MLQDYDEIAIEGRPLTADGGTEQGPNGKEDHDNTGCESQTDRNLSPAFRRPVRQATLAARQKLAQSYGVINNTI